MKMESVTRSDTDRNTLIRNQIFEMHPGDIPENGTLSVRALNISIAAVRPGTFGGVGEPVPDPGNDDPSIILLEEERRLNLHGGTVSCTATELIVIGIKTARIEIDKNNVNMYGDWIRMGTLTVRSG